MGRRKPYASGTQNVTDFQDNVKKNNNGKNGNGTGNKTANTMTESKQSLLNPTPVDTTGQADLDKLNKRAMDIFFKNNPGAKPNQ